MAYNNAPMKMQPTPARTMQPRTMAAQTGRGAKTPGMPPQMGVPQMPPMMGGGTPPPQLGGPLMAPPAMGGMAPQGIVGNSPPPGWNPWMALGGGAGMGNGGMGAGLGGGGGIHPALQLPFQAGSQDRNTALMNFLRRLFAGGMR